MREGVSGWGKMGVGGPVSRLEWNWPGQHRPDPHLLLWCDQPYTGSLDLF